MLRRRARRTTSNSSGQSTPTGCCCADAWPSSSADDQIAEGMELASPDLVDGLKRWRDDPATKRSRSAERSLVRYLTRAASRPDLFGLAGGYAIGGFTDTARLELSVRSELQARAFVDSGLLQQVVRRAAADAAGDPALVVRRNTGIYRAGGRLRVAARVPGSAKHRLVAMKATPSIELALATAGDGATVDALVETLVEAGSPADHAPTLIGRLIASDMLVPTAEVTVTGPEPTRQAIAALDSLPGSERYAEAVRQAAAAVAGAPRQGSDTVAAVAAAIEPTGIEVSRRRCIQVDSRRPGAIELPGTVLAEMRRAIELLARIVPPPAAPLKSFCRDFERRFATRSVPLLEALDPDFGVRFDWDDQPEFDPRAVVRRRALLALVDRGRRTGAVELGDRDIEALARRRPAALPSAFGIITRLDARDAAAVTSGAFQLVEPVIHGPSGARLLGRLCRGDAELEAHVRDHLAREAALDPEVVFAEMSLAPETDAGLNITQRPVMREWEIEYGGASGAPPSRRLEPADLMVSVEDGEVVLRSVSLERRVIPTCNTAMNPMWVSLPAARFMLLIAHQGAAANLRWQWEDLADAPELPCVTHGRTILTRRRWNVTAAEFEDSRPGTDAAAFRRLQEWRAARGIPLRVGFDHPRSLLLVDFDNVLSVDAFLSSTRDLDVLRFVETAAGDPSPVHGPDGRYAHELIVPFTLTSDRATQRLQRSARKPVSESQRRFAPGCAWLYANLYGPVASADRVLVDHVGPLVERLREAGLVDRWFFIRYADPERHLRVRFHGRPGDLLGEVLPALHAATAPALTEGLLYRMSLDTYEREVERYGGLEGVELMEQLAEADSDAVIEILRRPVGAVERRHLTVASLAGLYAGAKLPLESRRECCVQLRTAWAPSTAGSLGALLGADERAERAKVSEIVAAIEHDSDDLSIAALRRRSVALLPILTRLVALDTEGVLERSLDDVMCSHAHMGVNRLLKRGANHDELRIHDALARLYEAQIARERATARSQR